VRNTRSFSTLWLLAHPEKGVRFSPSQLFDLKNNVVLKPEECGINR